MPAESPLDRRFREAHRRRIAAQLPALAWVVTGGTVLWYGLADLADAAAMRLALPVAWALAILVVQGLLFAGAVVVREDERKRVSFDLHDDVCQELVGIGILIESAVGRIAAPPEVTGDLSRATRYLREVVDHLRVLARDLRPISLHDLGLEASLRSLAAGLSNDRTHVHAAFPTMIPRLEESVELTVYRIAQEAVTNAVRHADAREVTLELRVAGDRLALTVCDDGRGFDPSSGELRALGLASMEERALAIVGRLTVTSRAGEGTTVVLDSPLVIRPSATAA